MHNGSEMLTGTLYLTYKMLHPFYLLLFNFEVTPQIATYRSTFLFLDACEIKKCQPGSRCKVFEPTGEAFCEPSCDIDNGGCPAGQSCTLLDVQCVRAPCPPVVQCMDTCALPAVTGPCDGAFPRYFHNATSEQCERFIFGGCGGNENNFETLKECESQCEQGELHF